MQNRPDLNENFKFLILEVRKQIDDTLNTLQNGEDYSIEKIIRRDDYVDNMRNLIRRKSYASIMNAGADDRLMLNSMMALNTLTSNLEKVSDYCEIIVKQTHYFHDREFIKRFNFQEYFNSIFQAFELIPDSLSTGDINSAMEICRSEFKIDKLYSEHLNVILNSLKKGGEETGDLITSLFIFQHIERLGDALLNMGEAIISKVIGSRLKIQHYMALQNSLNGSPDMFELETMGCETKSGCNIEKLKSKSALDPAETIFKEGYFKKLETEKKNLELWDSLFPGLTPRVVGFSRVGEDASLLLEYMYGYNFLEILMNNDSRLVDRAIFKIIEITDHIWTSTKKPDHSSASFIDQLSKRINDVYTVHPYLKNTNASIGSIEKKSFETLIAEAADLERTLTAPFSVLIHGDFNNDNIIYNQNEDRLHYIDLNRSTYSDYVQDVSVFIVSNFRMLSFSPGSSDLINYVIMNYFDFALKFAEKNDDGCFMARLALGLIRSFVTSTRFALNHKFARGMFLRSEYLIEHLLKHSSQGGEWRDFSFNKAVLAY